MATRDGRTFLACVISLNIYSLCTVVCCPKQWNKEYSQFVHAQFLSVVIIIACYVLLYILGMLHYTFQHYGQSLTIIAVPESKVHGANMGPSGADRTQVEPMLAPWTLSSGVCNISSRDGYDQIRLQRDDTLGQLYCHVFTLIQGWICNHMPCKVCDEIAYLFINFDRYYQVRLQRDDTLTQFH